MCSIVDYYGRCSAAVRKTFHGMVKKVLRGMGMDSPAVLDLLENPPPGEENWNMLLHVSQILCESGYSRSPPIVHAILRLYFEHTDRDPRFLVHVIQNLSLAELQEALPKLLTLPERVKQLAFRKLLSSPPIPGKSAVPADGLLVLLHTVDVPTKTAVEGVVQTCSCPHSCSSAWMAAWSLESLFSLSSLFHGSHLSFAGIFLR